MENELWASIWARQHLCKILILERKPSCMPALLLPKDSIILHFLHSDQSFTHSLHRLPLHKNSHCGISSFIMPCPRTMIIGDQWICHAMPTTGYSGINEICHARSSVTELVLSEWRSMLSSDTSDPKFWIKTFYMLHSLVHHATPLRPYVHQLLSYMQVLYFLFSICQGKKKTWG